MAAPTAPDLTSITTEGLKRSGITVPSSADLSRAQTYWMREIKNDIAVRIKNAKFLHTTAYGVTAIGQSRYAVPTDFYSDLTLTLLYGSNTGIATGGAVGSITLAANEDVTEGFMLGKQVLVTSGTGKNSFSQCTAYNPTTKADTVTPNFAVAPASGSGYMVIDTYYQLKQKPIWELDELNFPTDSGRSEVFMPIGDVDDGEFVLYPAPDKVYGMQMRYYADIMEVDLASTLMGTLYKKWESLWVQGIFVKALAGKNDKRYIEESRKYEYMLNGLAADARYGNELNNLQMRITG
ncbi:MAG: hypothetical protein NUW09_02570 [Deltaproteobacteria bacterium]|nr:hypothetical protein [Deltaproteobacteria bacterium]